MKIKSAVRKHKMRSIIALPTLKSFTEHSEVKLKEGEPVSNSERVKDLVISLTACLADGFFIY